MRKLVALFVAVGLLCGLGMSISSRADAAVDKEAAKKAALEEEKKYPQVKKPGQTVIKMAGMKQEGEPETIGMRKFGQYLNELSDGKYYVQVFPNSLMGKEDAYIDLTKRGAIQMCATGTQMSKYLPAMAMMETPMMFDDLAHAHRAMNGETFELINEGFPEKSGMRTLNAFPLGYRHFYTKKPVKSINDVKGLKMRVPNIPLYTNFAKEVGLSAQAMPYAEVPGALEQGVIEGGDSPLSDIVAASMYEYAPEITKTGHILVIHSLFINDKFYQNLPEQDKKWFDEAAHRAAEDVWKMVEEGDIAAEQKIAANKGTVSEPTPELKEYMKQAGERSWKLFTDPNSKQYAPNAQKILDSAAKYREASN